MNAMVSLTQKFCALWAQSLKLDQVTPDQSYFDAGGDSFSAVGLVAKIRRETGLSVMLRDLFNAPTPRSLAQTLSMRQASSDPGADAGPAPDFDRDADPTGLPVPSRAGRGHGDARKVLVTGATGLLGRHLVRELLLNTDERVYCLVRAPNAEAGLERLALVLNEGGLDVAALHERLEALPGDIGATNLGLSEALFNRLAEEIETIYHSAASVNSVASYENLKPFNVLGTREILKLAATGPAKDLHYISTVAVFRPHGATVAETDLPEPAASLEDGYAQTKAVAENLVRRARALGINSNIYRMGMIVGDTTTGAANMNDYTSSFIKGCIQAEAWPAWRINLHFVPADRAATALIALSRHGAANHTFHLQDPAGVTLDKLGLWVERYGFRLAQLAPDDWLARVRACGDVNSLAPFVPGLIEAVPEYNSAAVSHDGTQGLYSRLDCAHTSGVLRDLGCAWASIDRTLMHTYLDFYVSNGFLAHPEVMHHQLHRPNIRNG